MPIDDSIKTATSTIGLVSDILKAAGENPKVKEAGQNLGQTALIITKTINNALLPIAAVNFAFDKARIYFSNKFEKDLLEKSSSIPLEYIVEPKASIAGPTLQGLAFTHEEANLKDMYLNLLATAMDGRVALNAHPAFVEIIKQLNSAEAHLIRDILRTNVPIPIVEVKRAKTDETNFSSLRNHLLNLLDVKSGEAIEDSKIEAMVDNWIRLGLVNVDYARSLTADNSYSWVNDRPEVIKFQKIHTSETHKISFTNGVIFRTALGAQFANAVGLL